MKTILKRISMLTHHETELINITPHLLELVQSSGIKNGTVFVLSLHTTTAITVNEGLPDLEKDITEMILRLVPEGQAYHHARYLPSDGQMAVNAPLTCVVLCWDSRCSSPLRRGISSTARAKRFTLSSLMDLSSGLMWCIL